mgnify:CR=1 FL=1
MTTTPGRASRGRQATGPEPDHAPAVSARHPALRGACPDLPGCRTAPVHGERDERRAPRRERQTGRRLSRTGSADGWSMGRGRGEPGPGQDEIGRPLSAERRTGRIGRDPPAGIVRGDGLLAAQLDRRRRHRRAPPARSGRAFYSGVIPSSIGEDTASVMRQALAGMLWSKQAYDYDGVDRWLDEHGVDPFAPGDRSAPQSATGSTCRPAT